MLLASELWDFSVSLYAAESVEHQCLLLQNQYNLNVNVLLLCCFLDKRKEQLSEADMPVLLDAISDNQIELAAFREQRLKNKGTVQYQSLLKEELNIEKQQQALLVDALNTLNMRQWHNTNIRIYIQSLFPVLTDQLKIEIETLIEATNKQQLELEKMEHKPLI